MKKMYFDSMEQAEGQTEEQAHREYLIALNRQSIDIVHGKPVSTAERITILKERIKALDSEIFALQARAENEDIPEQELIELKERRDGLQAELFELLPEKDCSRYETCAEWLKACEHGNEKEIYAPIDAMLYRFARKFKTRTAWDILHLTETGHTVSTQNTAEYRQTIICKLYEMAIDEPEKNFGTALFTATKDGIEEQWNRTHSRKMWTDTDGKTHYGENVHFSFEKDLWEPDIMDGEPVRDVVHVDSYAGTESHAIREMYIDSIMEQARGKSLEKVLSMYASGYTFREIATVTGKTETSVNKSKERYAKEMRKAFPELCPMPEPVRDGEGHRVFKPVPVWAKFKHYRESDGYRHTGSFKNPILEQRRQNVQDSKKGTLYAVGYTPEQIAQARGTRTAYTDRWNREQAQRTPRAQEPTAEQTATKKYIRAWLGYLSALNSGNVHAVEPKKPVHWNRTGTEEPRNPGQVSPVRHYPTQGYKNAILEQRRQNVERARMDGVRARISREMWGAVEQIAK